MSAPVDVLAVIDEAIDTLRDDGNRALPGDLEIARAAVAELIEAAKELRGLMEDVRTGEYKPDTFTVQSIDAALALVQGVRS